MSDFQGISMEAMKIMNEKASKIKTTQIRENPKELYNIWIESYSDTFKEFFRSGHFSSDMENSCQVFSKPRNITGKCVKNTI